MANKARGEVDLGLAGTAYVLRPTFEAQVEIEDRTGVSMLALLRQVAAASIRTRDAAIVVWCGAKAWNPKIAGKLSDVGARLAEEGLTGPVVAALGDFLSNAVGGTRRSASDSGGEAEESPTPPAGPPSAG